MITNKLDDALIHQNYGTIANVVDEDVRWFDRYYMNLQAIDGSLSIGQGTGVYPNMGVMDGFGMISTPDFQVNVRASRELVNGDRDVMTVGPVHAEIIEPMKVWRFWLEENEQGITYDFLFESDFDAMEAARLESIVEGRRVFDWTHFAHAGRARGWARVDGKTIDLRPDSHYIIRDRSWGVRPGTAVIADMAAWWREANWGSRHNWLCAQVDSFYIWYFLTEEADGTGRYFEGLVRWNEAHGGGQEAIARVERRMNFAADDHFLSAGVDIHLASGRVLPINLRRTDTSAHLRGGGYGGINGLIHGMKQGPLTIVGERWEPADSRHNPASMGLQDHVVELTWEGERGCGILELGFGT